MTIQDSRSSTSSTHTTTQESGPSSSLNGTSSGSSHARVTVRAPVLSSNGSSSSSSSNNSSSTVEAAGSAAGTTSGRHHSAAMDNEVAVAVAAAGEDNNNHYRLGGGERPLQNGCEDKWSWSKRDRSKEVWLSGANNRTVHFHPNWSKGTAGIRGTRVLNNGRYYWELSVSQRVFGTSMMFGIGTKKARLHVNAFTNLLGEDKNGWGLSHKGLLWHDGMARNYTKRFKENQATKIGILFDGIAGTLTYYKDEVCLGIAFRGLNEIREPLYPIVCSTAAKTEMVLTDSRRDFVNLQDRCRAIIIKHIKTREKLDRLNLPHCITNYLADALTDSSTPVTPLDQHLIDYYLF
ncbi:SPRY domain-containing SOCS box protein 3 [Aedes albopictus]|uniref:SPRY domain-containing SOCS box protein 3 n=1 Tax=Aedes albopictus TaxID=7160 RepID=A0ABM2A114_AEDAL|nr:SPRY domain-containing SOCS box protein 3-like [Aedes albopictus]